MFHFSKLNHSISVHNLLCYLLISERYFLSISKMKLWKLFFSLGNQKYRLLITCRNRGFVNETLESMFQEVTFGEWYIRCEIYCTNSTQFECRHLFNHPSQIWVSWSYAFVSLQTFLLTTLHWFDSFLSKLRAIIYNL